MVDQGSRTKHDHNNTSIPDREGDVCHQAFLHMDRDVKEGVPGVRIQENISVKKIGKRIECLAGPVTQQVGAVHNDCAACELPPQCITTVSRNVK